MSQAAVFIDKEGTLVENVPDNVDPGRIALTAGAAQGLAALVGHGFRVIVVSNQPGVALGLYGAAELRRVEQRLRELVPALGAFYFCTHGSHAGCKCRKPAAGMLLRAAREHRIRLDQSWMIGDVLDDIEAGRRAGCRTLLLDNGNETGWHVTPARTPNLVAHDLAEAAGLILEQHERLAASV